MNGLSKSACDCVIISMLEQFENKKYTELISNSWKTLYNLIIPFNYEDIEIFLTNYIIILKQTIAIKEIAEETTKILSIIDLIIHPRKGTIIEDRHEIEDLQEEIPQDEETTPEDEKAIPEEDTNKRVKINIIE
jgi:hypothetical protein